MRKDIKTLRQVVYLFKRMHFRWWHFFAPVALSLFAAAFEGVGMGLLIPMLEGFLTKDYSFIKEIPVLSNIIAWLPDAIVEADRWLFASLMSFFVIATLLKNVLRYCSVLSISYLGYRALHHLRKLLFTRYMSFGKLYFDQSNVGHHSVVLSEFAMQALKPLLTVNKYINALFSTIVYLIVMMLISWKLTLFAIPLLLLMHFSVKYFIEIIRRLSNNLAKNTKDLSKKTIEILSLIFLVQSYNMEAGEKDHYKYLSDMRAKLEFHRSAVRNIITPLQELLTLVAMLFLFSGMLYLMVRDGASAAPPFIIYFYLVMNSAAKFGTLTGFRGDLANASAPVEAVLEILNDDDKYFVPSGPQKITTAK